MFDSPLKTAVLVAAARSEAVAAVHGLYADLRRAIDARRPVCRVSGRCCRFEEYGHRLYVTTLELAAFVNGRAAESDGALASSVELPGPTPQTDAGVPIASPKIAREGNGGTTRLPVSWDGKGCPFQVDGLCGVHAIRPFGCRVYFCDATAQQWQEEQYQQFHARLRQLHEELGVAYYYVEWRTALEQVLGIQAADNGC